MSKLEDFAKLLSSDLALAKKCLDANFDIVEVRAAKATNVLGR